MKVERRTGSDERLILTGMITDGRVLAQVARHWQGGMFHNKWANLVGSWCVDYYRKYEKPPGQYIETLASNWEAGNPPKETVSMIDRFLTGLSDEYVRNGKTNSQYVVDRASEYFNQVRVRKLMEQCEEDLDENRSTKSLDRIREFRKLEMGTGGWMDPLEDVEAMKQALTHNTKPLIRFSGDLGKFFGDTLQRNGFVSFLGSEKRGKSFFLMEMVYQALRDHCRVAYFEVGDMTQDQILRRWASRITRRPLRSRVCRVPISIERDPDRELADVILEDREPDPLTPSMVAKAQQRFIETKVKGRGHLRLSSHPTSTMSAVDVLNTIHAWAQEDNWVVDVVVIDYADILAPIPGSGDGRDQINATWMQLRRLSQELGCLVITATQADAASYDASTIGMRHFSEDKRKMAHVTGMIGLNQTPREREQGITRLNWIVRREDSILSKPVHVAGCLALSAPAIKSTF